MGLVDDVDCEPEELDETGAPLWPEMEGVLGSEGLTPTPVVLGNLPLGLRGPQCSPGARQAETLSQLTCLEAGCQSAPCLQWRKLTVQPRQMLQRLWPR